MAAAEAVALAAAATQQPVGAKVVCSIFLNFFFFFKFHFEPLVFLF